MQGVLQDAPPRGPTPTANAAATDPAAAATAHLNAQAFSISARSTERGAGRRPLPGADGERVSGRAGSALRALSGFGLAAGAGIGVAAGAVALLTKNLNASGREAQALQTLSCSRH